MNKDKAGGVLLKFAEEKHILQTAIGRNARRQDRVM